MTLEAVLAAAVDGLRLGTLMCCIGAANALANPRRALRVLPGALYELGITVVVAISIAPAAGREHPAGAPRPPAAGRVARRVCARCGGILMPVLEDALDRSLLLAAAMDSRGYGRTGHGHAEDPAAHRRPAARGAAGTVRRRLRPARRNRAQPPRAALAGGGGGPLRVGPGPGQPARDADDVPARPLAWPEWVVAGCGVLTAVVFFVTSSYDPLNLTPVDQPVWRGRRCRSCRTLAVLLAALPAVVAPPPVRSTRDVPTGRAGGPRAGTRVITFDQVTVTYVDAAAAGAARRDLTIEEGELCLVVGRTGVGKSSFLGAINGLVPHFTGGTLAGRVVVDGRDTAHHPPRELADVVGVVGQDPLAGFVTDTVEEELAYGMEQLAVPAQVMRKRVEETLDLLGLADLRGRAAARALRRPAAAGRHRVGAHRAPPRSSCSTSPPRPSTPPRPRRCSPPSPGWSTTSASPSSSPSTGSSGSSSTPTG